MKWVREVKAGGLQFAVVKTFKYPWYINIYYEVERKIKREQVAYYQEEFMEYAFHIITGEMCWDLIMNKPSRLN